MLAKLLLAEPDLMLLDEPSNHLDIEPPNGSRNSSSKPSGRCSWCSHDRYFLDRVTNRTLELFPGTVDSYAGQFLRLPPAKGRRIAGRNDGPTKASRRKSPRPKTSFAATTTAKNTLQAEDRRKTRTARACRPREIAVARHGVPVRRHERRYRRPRAERLAKGFRPAAFRRPRPSNLSAASDGALSARTAAGKNDAAALPAGLNCPDAGRVMLGSGRHRRLLRPAPGSRLEDTLRRRRHPPGSQGFRHRNSAATCWPVSESPATRPSRRSQPERRRAVPRRPWPAWPPPTPTSSFLDEPTNHLDLWARDALETALNRVRWHGPPGEPRPLLREPRLPTICSWSSPAASA